MNIVSFFIYNHLSWFWLAVMILCIIIEALTVSLTTIWFACSALLLIFLSLLKLPILLQVFLFLAIATLLLIFTRPIFLKKIQPQTKTNVESLKDKEVILSKKITKFEKGLAKIDGILWSADSEQNQEIPEGTICKIVNIHGNTITVKPV